MTPLDDLRARVARLQAEAATLAVLASRLAQRVEGRAPPEWLAAPLDGMAAVHGLDALLEGADPQALAPILGEVRTFSLLLAKLVRGGDPVAPGWATTDAQLLDAAGAASAGFPRMLADRIAPQLPGLADRLAQPGARFLDVGTGVGALAMAMLRAWPALQATGIDVWPPALARAHSARAAEGFDGRFELRELDVQQLDDVAAYDLAWLPGAFVPEDAVRAGLPRLRRALKPGGWLLVAVLQPGEQAHDNALARLRIALLGGCPADRGSLLPALMQAGFSEARALPAAPGALVALLAARA